jgi:raffinose/stachyose/melibiose transport system permease protein
LYEAATIDGAGSIQKIFFITIPNLSESFKIFSILCVTGCLRSFDLIFVMTNGGPAHATTMPALLLYNEAFKYQNFGGGNSIGVFILVVGLGLSLLFNKFIATEGN